MPTIGKGRRGPPRQPPGDAESHRCAWPGCGCEAAYPAPRSRQQLREFQWLCLEHVREFNRGWDYFQGMDRSQIEAHARADTTWHRPSWRFGSGPGTSAAWDDVFELFDESDPRPPARPRTPADEMMAILDLAPGFTLDELKTRYHQLAKANHPDLHGGDRDAEERLKRIIEAYTFLREQHLQDVG